MVPLILEYGSSDNGVTSTLRINGKTFYCSYAARIDRATCYILDAMGNPVDDTRRTYTITNWTPSPGSVMKNFVLGEGEQWPEKVVDE